MNQEEFIEEANNDVFQELTLTFNEIKVTLKGDTLNRCIRDYFNFQKPSLGTVPFDEYLGDLYYFTSRGCKISNIEFSYKGNLWYRIQTFTRVTIIERMKG